MLQTFIFKISLDQKPGCDKKKRFWDARFRSDDNDGADENDCDDGCEDAAAASAGGFDVSDLDDDDGLSGDGDDSGGENDVGSNFDTNFWWYNSASGSGGGGFGGDGEDDGSRGAGGGDGGGGGFC